MLAKLAKQKKGEISMSTEENKALMRRWIETVNQRNLAVFDELCARDFVYHDASKTMQGLEPYIQVLSMYLTAIPDLHITLEDVIAEGDRVVTRQTYRGTQQGNLLSIPPTGKQVTLTGIAITRIASGKVIEQWVNNDDMGLLQQLGVVPTPGQAS
jgi:steroid delta-isomerase-like uncharacterized protein